MFLQFVCIFILLDVFVRFRDYSYSTARQAKCNDWFDENDSVIKRVFANQILVYIESLWSFLYICFTETMKPGLSLKSTVIGCDSKLWVATNRIWIRCCGEKDSKDHNDGIQTQEKGPRKLGHSPSLELHGTQVWSIEPPVPQWALFLAAIWVIHPSDIQPKSFWSIHTGHLETPFQNWTAPHRVLE